MDPPKSFFVVPEIFAVDERKKCPGAKRSSRRQPGRREDCFEELTDAAMAEDMDLAEQRSKVALPQAIPGASAAWEAAEAAQAPFEAEVHGQGDERRDVAARSRDLQSTDPRMQRSPDASEPDTHPHFEDNRMVTDRASSKTGQPSRACARATPPDVPFLDGLAPTDSRVTGRQGLGARAGRKSLA